MDHNIPGAKGRFSAMTLLITAAPVTVPEDLVVMPRSINPPLKPRLLNIQPAFPCAVNRTAPVLINGDSQATADNRGRCSFYSSIFCLSASVARPICVPLPRSLSIRHSKCLRHTFLVLCPQKQRSSTLNQLFRSKRGSEPMLR